LNHFVLPHVTLRNTDADGIRRFVLAQVLYGADSGAGGLIWKQKAQLRQCMA
jgi:hypothetical protein